LEETLIALLKEYGYIILFIWSIMEGEMGLVMAGIMSYTGDMDYWTAVVVASAGGFLGDQIYFWIGRYNKSYFYQEFKSQRRKVAFAHVLLKKYGWPVIFIQRYMYGMRTIIPMAIGITRYNSKMFAFINFISAIIWAMLTITLAYLFGEELLALVRWIKDHYYVALPVAFGLMGIVYWYMHRATQK
jgi:membrane protein DedA with SNARE-associated domain